MDMWLEEEGISSGSCFTPFFDIYHKDCDYTAKRPKFGGGVLIAATSLKAHRWLDLGKYDKSVWTEGPSSDGLNYLIGNYFPTLFDPHLFVDHINELN